MASKWTRKSIPGHLFEITDEDGTPVLRIRGGMMPTLEHARLIAAAPALLEAARLTLEAITASEWLSDDARLGVYASKLRAAIAAAEGE
jgi:hypothetical protein